jgi:hypothetical protein
MSHSSYANPQRIRYDTGRTAIQFGADTETVAYEFVGPKGKKGLVRDIEIEITEDMVGTTTVPEINVGSAASALGTLKTEYGRFRLGSAAGTGYATSLSPNPIRASSLVNTYNEVGSGGKTSGRFTGHVELEKDFIPPDTSFFITLVAGSGGTETGAGVVAVEIDWF